MNKKGNCSTTEPIRDIEKINDMAEYLYKHSRRVHLVFILGINSGLRVSDLLNLTVEDVINGVVTIREKKTRKEKQFALSDTCMEAINEYISYSGVTTGLLFDNGRGKDKAITKQAVWKLLNQAADWCGVTENVGTHSMRKAFSYHALRNGVDISFIMEALNHSDLTHTKRYIGIRQDEMDEVLYKNMHLGGGKK
jgi:site-specific recombinase XerD